MNDYVNERRKTWTKMYLNPVLKGHIRFEQAEMKVSTNSAKVKVIAAGVGMIGNMGQKENGFSGEVQKVVIYYANTVGLEQYEFGF